jgi:hypothetical protein
MSKRNSVRNASAKLNKNQRLTQLIEQDIVKIAIRPVRNTVDEFETSVFSGEYNCAIHIPYVLIFDDNTKEAGAVELIGYESQDKNFHFGMYAEEDLLNFLAHNIAEHPTDRTVMVVDFISVHISHHLKKPLIPVVRGQRFTFLPIPPHVERQQATA